MVANDTVKTLHAVETQLRCEGAVLALLRFRVCYLKVAKIRNSLLAKMMGSPNQIEPLVDKQSASYNQSVADALDRMEPHSNEVLLVKYNHLQKKLLAATQALDDQIQSLEATITEIMERDQENHFLYDYIGRCASGLEQLPNEEELYQLIDAIDRTRYQAILAAPKGRKAMLTEFFGARAGRLAQKHISPEAAVVSALLSSKEIPLAA